MVVNDSSPGGGPVEPTLCLDVTPVLNKYQGTTE